MKEIGQKELKAFEEFENKILSLNVERVKYQRDGEQTNDLLNKLSLTFLDLTNQSTYVEIYNFLSENKKNG